MSANDENGTRNGMLHPSIALLVESTRTVKELAARTGRAGAHAVLPSTVVAPVNHMLTSLRNTVEQVPYITDEIDVLMSELQAKRLSLQAVTAELIVLDHQLEILEKTLSPVQTWSTQFTATQHSLTRSFMHSVDPVHAAAGT